MSEKSLNITQKAVIP